MERREEDTELEVVAEDGVAVVEGAPEKQFVASLKDVDRVLEACFSAKADVVLLYASNLTEDFFDLSSGQVGALLQKLRNYGIRLAVVWRAGDPPWSSRFGEMVAEERRGDFFRLFETREAARAWLGGFQGTSG
ncbi:DUF4180 domain-containing protein [Chondromyces apiculatus]|uniref:DUF4180 domain-containing protein n=1 Tax=Chondromyces apiculatus DSM 436 TaxID=1192034 RepID=A0A017SW29_9BACT|nr:DUF4180 domain-containing protein [Chondromyces apiculatus]EYF01188.1 Hypothetical protein CAP_8529 [Chondromyces apiculatus DSM 436]